jgi:hypothetical protein
LDRRRCEGKLYGISDENLEEVEDFGSGVAEFDELEIAWAYP